MLTAHRRGIIVTGMVIAAGVLAGCGGSSGSSTVSSPSAAQLQAAKKEGEKAARERDRVAALQRQVHAIKRQVGHERRQRPRQAAPTPVAPTTTATTASGSVPVRSFHAPSGNVSCEVFVEGATCTVASVGETFVLEPGAPARIESAAALPRGLGEATGYGSVVSGGGSVSCEVPPSDVPRGISCADSADGHGFEASRIRDRQEAY
jgi:hypothetical protein